MKRKFSYWWCETHACGSYSMNNLARHVMPWCDINKDTRILTKPKTYGGYNGDVSRKHYKDWDKYCVEQQQKKQRMVTWKKQVEANEDNVDYHRKKFQEFLEKL